MEVLEKLRSSRAVKNVLIELNKSVAVFAQSMWYNFDEFSQTLTNLASSMNDVRFRPKILF